MNWTLHIKQIEFLTGNLSLVMKTKIKLPILQVNSMHVMLAKQYFLQDYQIKSFDCFNVRNRKSATCLSRQSHYSSCSSDL